VVNSDRRAELLAWLFTAGVAASVLITAWPQGQVRLEYDATLLLTGLTVIGAIWTAYFARKAYLDQRATVDYLRESRRRALATAAIFEVEGLLRKLGPRTGPLNHPVLDHMVESADVFTRQTVAELVVALQELEAYNSDTIIGKHNTYPEAQLRCLLDRLNVDEKPGTLESLPVPVITATVQL
jgi:hypothetical protein